MRFMTRVYNDLLNSGATLGPLIVQMFKSQGRDFKTCEICSKPIKGKYVLHHTKYDGATIKDIRISCKSCDQKAENKNLM